MCCCGHDEALHLGGPDLDAAQLEEWRLAHLGGDGGMCRFAIGGPSMHGRCDCFNFCDCLTVKYDLVDDDEPIHPGELASIITDLLKDPRCEGYDGLTVSFNAAVKS